MGEDLKCQAPVYHHKYGGARPCPNRAKWWVALARDRPPRAFCGTHANAWTGVGVKRYALITGDVARDAAWAEDGDVS